MVFLNPFWGGESPGTRNVAVSNGKNTVEQPTRRLYTLCILADNSNEIGSLGASPHGSAISSARKIEAWRRKPALWNTSARVSASGPGSHWKTRMKPNGKKLWESCRPPVGYAKRKHSG